ncbi:MAG: hypothetical protein H0V17_08640 [Deltaproteobacteria bacterium]|nr:hypothetical protein [Deltaproteobacteria bacterium]
MRKLVLLFALTACSINHRTDQLACERQNDCDRGQTCSDGFCLTVGNPDDGPGPDPDGGPRPDSFSCPAQCTSCQLASMTCTVDCGQSPATCQLPINCPPGFNCNILCTRNEGCETINCTQGESCNIQCKGNGTCDNVTCGAGKCNVECTGAMACRGVDCHQSCACDVACGNNATCLNVSCPGEPLQCSGFGLDRCSSDDDGCNTCE